MSYLQIVCDNCGAGYRLPTTSTSNRATCKQCGSVIDVGRQRAAAASAGTPQAGRPAARPAARAAKPAPPPPHEGRPRHLRSPTEPLREEQLKNRAPLVFGGIALVGAIVVIGVLALGGGGKDDKRLARAQAPAAPAPEPKAAPQPSDAGARKKPVVESGPESIAEKLPPGQAPAQKTPDKPAAGAPKGVNAAALQDEKEKLVLKDLDAWQKMQVKSMDQVFDPKKGTQPFESTEVSDADKQKLAGLLQKARDGAGAAPTTRALAEMVKMGYPALVFLINSLREIDYKSADDTMFAYQLNQTLTILTLGVNTGFVPVEVDEKIDPRKANWNAKSVEKWLAGLKSQWPTKAKYDEYVEKRKAKKDAELEQEGK